ncbi:glycosyl hydrolase, family 31, partial [Oesophagostomum dentatum]
LQEVVTGPGPHLVYRTIGGQLNLAFFPGPTPEEVIQQYLAHIGTPFLPAYWALGYQVRALTMHERRSWGYKDLNDMKTVVARVQAAQIPLDIVYADIDYMDRYKDFTVGANWADFGAYVDELHKMGLHLILIFDPAVEVDYATFQRGRDKVRVMQATLVKDFILGFRMEKKVRVPISSIPSILFLDCPTTLYGDVLTSKRIIWAAAP